MISFVSLLMLPLAVATSIPGSTTSVLDGTGQDQGRVERALEAIQALEPERLASDPRYAQEVLAHADALLPHLKDEPELRDAIALVRLGALAVLGEEKETRRAIGELVASGSKSPAAYAAAFELALALAEPDLALETLEAASRNLTSADREQLRPELDFYSVRRLRNHYTNNGDKPAKARLARVLVELEWPAPDRVEDLDWLRLELIDLALSEKNMAAGKRLAQQIASPTVAMRLLTTRRYDPVVDADDRSAKMEVVLRDYGRLTELRLAREPEDMKSALFHAQHLRSLGREEEAAKVLAPFVADWSGVKEGGEDALWIVNEAAYASGALGRQQEAVRLMDRLVELGFDHHPELISMAINRTEVLLAAGLHRQAAMAAVQLAEHRSDLANAYGRMWMWAGAACGFALAGDMAAAKPWLERLEKGSKDNYAAHMRALLCSNELDAAERLAVRRLEGDQAPVALQAMQDYQLADYSSATRKLIEQRWRQVVSRPAVQAAIGRVGRVLSLPMSRVYWGEF